MEYEEIGVEGKNTRDGNERRISKRRKECRVNLELLIPSHNNSSPETYYSKMSGDDGLVGGG